MRFPSKEIVERVRSQYPVGTRVELTQMDDMQAPPIGTKGTVTGVDDTASIMVRWDNGSGGCHTGTGISGKIKQRLGVSMVKLYVVRMTKGKIRFAIPIIVLLVLFPVMIGTIMTGSGNSDDTKTVDLVRQLHVWIPLLSGWWTIVFTNDFFSSGGNELMYLFHNTVDIFIGQIASMMLYLVLVSGCFCLYNAMYPMEDAVLYQLLIESAMVCSLTFFACFLFQNTGAALMINVIYCIYLNLFDTLQIFSFLSIFPQDTLFVKWDTEIMIKTLVSAILFLVGGTVLSKVQRVYK